jgi:hypothetical protein
VISRKKKPACGMAHHFSVRTTPHLDRLAKALRKRNKEFNARYREAMTVRADDLYNHGRTHRIKKLVAVNPNDGQWLLRLGRWRFRYDIESFEVVLHACSLRDESTYR